MKEDQLTLTVRARDKTLYEGQVKSVSALNDKGKFDVLGRHANFITLIKGKMTIRSILGKIDEIDVDGGVMRVLGNKINVFLGIRRNLQELKAT